MRHMFDNTATQNNMVNFQILRFSIQSLLGLVLQIYEYSQMGSNKEKYLNDYTYILFRWVSISVCYIMFLRFW